ncbi:kinase-like domain-containing protein [Polychytrium aggregatum]|uniref:kinase-like domain-containing protein n=1 Tax=Polychytrium aggregatum TaxID=110093 RepID=UPI0022FEE3EC|nr:kinase-like domain-containing protein [Polychytrium aggregatum]KAI9207409.1 kinase-like domain-containing protein [Polychytrium aggregatum]
MTDNLNATVREIAALTKLVFQGPVHELVRTANTLFSGVQTVHENKHTWKLLANLSLGILKGLIQYQGSDSTFPQKVTRLAWIHNQVQQLSTIEIDGCLAVERIFKAKSVRVRLEKLFQELDTLWQTTALALEISDAKLATPEQLSQALHEDEASERARISEIRDLVGNKSISVFDEVDIQIHSAQDWQIRKATDALCNLANEDCAVDNATEEVVGPLLSLLKEHSIAARSMQHEEWRVSSRQIVRWSRDPIASGGFGSVYTALYYGSEVAIKQLYGAYDENSIAEFRREIKIWHKLNHPNILILLGACDTVMKPFMISPLMRQGTLRDHVMNPTRPVPVEERIHLMYGVASGMSYLHGKQIIHGDLKPLNILLDSNLRAVISDFGMAYTKRTSSSLRRVRSGQAATGGTQGYMAPEMHGIGVDIPSASTKKTDVYAFGITLYEVMKGGPAWVTGNNTALLLDQILSLLTLGRRPAKLDSTSGEIWGLIEQCWSQNQLHRPVFPDIKYLSSPKPLPRPDPDQPALQGRTSLTSLLNLPGKLLVLLGPRSFLPLQRLERQIANHVLDQDLAVNHQYWKVVAQIHQRLGGCNDHHSRFHLGWMCLIGAGVPRDSTKAFQHWLAANTKSKDANIKSVTGMLLKWCYIAGQGTEQSWERGYRYWYTHNDVRGATPVHNQFFQWCYLGSFSNRFCKFMLAQSYLHGIRSFPNLEAAVGLLTSLIEEENYEFAFIELARCYYSGLGVAKDHDVAAYLYYQAAELGNAWGQFKFGQCLADGIGVSQDIDQAAVWMLKAVEQGHPEAIRWAETSIQ